MAKKSRHPDEAQLNVCCQRTLKEKFLTAITARGYAGATEAFREYMRTVVSEFEKEQQSVA